jgi:hypothetical protein
MPDVSATYLDLASRPKGELAALFDAGTPPDVRALTGFEFRGYNQPRAAALLGIRKFIKAFFPNGQGQPFGCNTPVRLPGRTARPRGGATGAARRRAAGLRAGRKPPI